MHGSSHICFPPFFIPCFFLPPIHTNTHTHFLPLFPPSFHLQGSLSNDAASWTSGWDWGTETMFILNLSFLSRNEALLPYASNLFCSAVTAHWCDAACTQKVQGFWNFYLLIFPYIKCHWPPINGAFCLSYADSSNLLVKVSKELYSKMPWDEKKSMTDKEGM